MTRKLLRARTILVSNFEIVARIETERTSVHGNRELSRIYEEKFTKVIERVWES